MRSSILHALSTLVLSTLVPVACSAPSEAPSTPPTVRDAGSETSLVPDAGSDADVNAKPEAGVKAPYVTVTVLHAARPLAGVSVVFHDAMGEIIEEAKTDIAGRARSSTPSPAMASALVGNQGNRHIVTWTGVEMGDELVTEDYSAYNDPRRYRTSVGKYSVELTRRPGIADYHVLAGKCFGLGNGSAPIPVDIYTQCDAPTQAIVARSVDVAALSKPHYSWKKNVPAPPGAGITSVPLGPFAPGETVSVDLLNRQAGQTAIGELTDFVGELPFYGPLYLLFTSPQDSALDMPPSGFADTRQVNVLVRGPTADGTSRSLIVRGAPKTSNPLDLAQLLPKLTSGTVSAANPARFELAWTSSATPSSVDGFVARVRYADPKVDEHYAWTFVLPPTASGVRAPKMPASAAAWLPDAKRSLFNTPHVWMMDFDSMSTYEAFRTTGARVLPLDVQDTSEREILLPTSDRLRVSTYFDPRSSLYP